MSSGLSSLLLPTPPTGFVIQGGDPNAKRGYGPGGTLDGSDKALVRKWGTGGPGYNVPAEFNPRKHEFGVLSMARSSDPDSAGSQVWRGERLVVVPHARVAWSRACALVH